MSYFKDLIRSLRPRGFPGGIIFGVVLTFGIAWSLLAALGLDLGNIFRTSLQIEESDQLLVDHFQRQQKVLRQLDHSAFRRTENMHEILGESVLDAEINRAEILDVASRNRDVIRATLELESIALKWAENDRLDRDAIEFLEDIMNAYAQMHKDEEHYYIDARKSLNHIAEHLDRYPEAQLEVIRHLAFCNFRLDDREQGDFWVRKANDLRPSDVTVSEYKRNYFWIDFFEFTIAIGDRDFDRADRAYERLREAADPGFVEAKVQQHIRNVPENERGYYRRYLDRIK